MGREGTCTSFSPVPPAPHHLPDTQGRGRKEASEVQEGALPVTESRTSSPRGPMAACLVEADAECLVQGPVFPLSCRKERVGQSGAAHRNWLLGLSNTQDGVWLYDSGRDGGWGRRGEEEPLLQTSKRPALQYASQGHRMAGAGQGPRLQSLNRDHCPILTAGIRPSSRATACDLF